MINKGRINKEIRKFMMFSSKLIKSDNKSMVEIGENDCLTFVALLPEYSYGRSVTHQGLALSRPLRHGLVSYSRSSELASIKVLSELI